MERRCRKRSVRMGLLLALVGRGKVGLETQNFHFFQFHSGLFYLGSKRSLVKGVRSLVKGMPYVADVETGS